MPRVVVFGSSNTDMTVRVPRLPAPGQTILGSTFSTTPGGKGANQAVAARRAGAEVVFVTAVGDDTLGKEALELYEREGIDVSHVRIVEGVASGVALIYRQRRRREYDRRRSRREPEAHARTTSTDLPASLFRKDDVLLVSLEIPVPTAIRALRRGFDAEMFTILNPAPAPALSEPELRELLSTAVVITPNRVEALALAGMARDPGAEPDWPACGFRLKEMGTAVVVITLGSRGCQVIAAKPWSSSPHPGSRPSTLSAPATRSMGRWRPRWRKARSFDQAVAWANAAGALAVTQPGAQSSLPFRDAIDRLAARGGSTLSELRPITCRSEGLGHGRSAGYRIVPR